jgi:hypothetical protein
LGLGGLSEEFDRVINADQRLGRDQIVVAEHRIRGGVLGAVGTKPDDRRLIGGGEVPAFEQFLLTDISRITGSASPAASRPARVRRVSLSDRSLHRAFGHMQFSS